MDARFTKMHGLGNDFVVFDERAGPLGITPTRAAALADRRTGIGCDQVICLGAPGQSEGAAASAYMRIYNADGSEVAACGNATRCVADLLFRQSRQRRHTIRTAAGDLVADVLGADVPVGTGLAATGPVGNVVAVDMGRPLLGWDQIPLARPCDTNHLDLAAGPLSDPAACSMGNPHATFFAESVDHVPLAGLGEALERNPLFPDRANIGVAQVIDGGRLRLRVWERGSGITRACGTAACAAVVNAARRGLAGRACTVQMDGGNLQIHWRDDDHVVMQGNSTLVFKGQVDLALYPA